MKLFIAVFLIIIVSEIVTVVRGQNEQGTKFANLPIYGAEKIGCFKDSGQRSFPKQKDFDRKIIDFEDHVKVVKLCRDFVLQQPDNYVYFGVQFDYQCFYGAGDEAALNFKRHGTGKEGEGCDNFIGLSWHNMVYKLDRSAL